MCDVGTSVYGRDDRNTSLCHRCISGHPARPCLPARKVFSRCHPSPSGLQTTNTFPRPTRASRASTCRFTPPNRSSSRSSSSPSRPRTSALCRGRRVLTYMLCNITSSIFVDFFCLYSFMKFKRKCCPILGGKSIFFFSLLFLFFFAVWVVNNSTTRSHFCFYFRFPSKRTFLHWLHWLEL